MFLKVTPPHNVIQSRERVSQLARRIAIDGIPGPDPSRTIRHEFVRSRILRAQPKPKPAAAQLRSNRRTLRVLLVTVDSRHRDP